MRDDPPPQTDCASGQKLLGVECSAVGLKWQGICITNALVAFNAALCVVDVVQHAIVIIHPEVGRLVVPSQSELIMCLSW